MSVSVILIGLVLTLTPAMAALRDGVAAEDADITQWLMQQPLTTLAAYSLMVSAGGWLIVAGIGLALAPRVAT